MASSRFLPSNGTSILTELCEDDAFSDGANMPATLQPLTQFLYYSGMRSGAAKQITWNMVEWEKVSGKQVAVGLKLSASLMKNHEDYVLPLAGRLTPMAETRNQGGFRTIDLPIFASTNFRRMWNKVCAKLGLAALDPKTQEHIGLHPHDFRRGPACNLIRAGVAPSVAPKVTGHKSARMYDRYNISDTTHVADALVAVGKYSKQVQEAAASRYYARRSIPGGAGSDKRWFG
jgi:integrase